MDETTLPEPELSPRAVFKTIVSIVFSTFVCYLIIGIPMAVLPGFVHNTLGYPAWIASGSVSLQFLSTALNRTWSGRMADSIGAKKTVMIGLAVCGVSGLTLPIAAYYQGVPWASLTAILIGRAILGFGESWAGTGAIVWGIGRVGAANTAKVISWNGVNTYGAVGLGAPLGVWMHSQFGLAGMGLFVVTLAVVGVVTAIPKPPPKMFHGERMHPRHIAGKVAPFGLSLASGAIGYGAITALVTLFYASQHWSNAAFALTAFGMMFVVGRLVLTNAIERFGGFRVGIGCLAVETVGLSLLALAPSAWVALVGAGCTGAGFALLFPAIGVEAVALVPATSRGAALGIFNLFLDLSLAFTGPIGGLIVGGVGYPGIYGATACIAAAGIGLTAWLWRTSRRSSATQLP